jgi:UDP-GlcNAc3NAcA epimerase
MWRAASAISNLRTLDPLGYLDMLALEQGARLIMTDSGGMQKEAYLLRKPCLTLREQTEWVETLGHGNRLVAFSEHDILKSAEEMIKGHFRFPENLYGRGDAARKIAKIIFEDFEKE